MRILLKELFITWICWLRWLTWWSIIRKIWLQRLFGFNTKLIVSKTLISNVVATRRLIMSIGVTSLCSSFWISLWMHPWKLIKIIYTKSTRRAIIVSKVVIWSIIYLFQMWPWSYFWSLQVLINMVKIGYVIIMSIRIIIIVDKCS